MIVTFAHLISIASALPTDASALESAISALVSEITTLESGSEFWEKSLPWFTGLVVLGLAADVVVIVWERRDELAAYRRWIHQGFHPAERPSGRKFALELLASAAILLGVAGELCAGAEIASINGQLRSKNAELRNKSNQLVALVTKETEDERLARVKIEARVAWRSLTELQKVEIGKALRHFPRITVAVGYEGTDAESSSFASDIADALHASHLNLEPEEGLLHLETPVIRKGHVIPTMETGVLVASTDDRIGTALALAISKELNNRGFDARIGPTEKRSTPWVRVDVGPRPTGPQGDFKLQAETDKSKH
jgi:hypothetical protein